MSTTINSAAKIDQGSWQPATPAERAAWHGAVVEKNVGAYLVPLQYRVEGRLALGDLRRALDAVIDTTDACRLDFRVVDGRLLRRVAPTLSRSPLISAGPDPETDALPFSGGLDFESGERLRVLAFGVGDDVHRILAVFDHVAFDGPAAAAVMGRIAAALRGEQLSSAPLAVADQASADAEARAAAFWSEHAHHLGRLDASGVATGAVVEGRTTLEDLPHTEACVAELADGSVATGVSELSMIGAAVSMLAATMTSSERVAVGMPFDLRRLSQLHAVGAFADVLPVPTSVPLGVSLRDHAPEFSRAVFSVARHRGAASNAVSPAIRADASAFPYYANAVKFDDVHVDDETRLLAEIPPFFAARFGIACYLLRTERQTRLVLAAEHPLVADEWRQLLAAQLSSLIRTGRPLAASTTGDALTPGDMPVPSDGASWIAAGAQLLGADGEVVHADELRSGRLMRVSGGSVPVTTVAIIGEVSVDLVRALAGAAEQGLRVLLIDPVLPETEIFARMTAARCDAWWSAGDQPLDGAKRVHLVAGADISPAPDGFAVVGFTSGSTGTARAVVCDAAALRKAFGWYRRALDLDSSVTIGVCSAVGHDPLLRDTLLPLAIGGRVAVPPRDVTGLDAWLRKNVVSVLHLTPTRAAMLQRAIRTDQEPVRSLRHVVLGGEILRHALAESLARIAPEARIWNAFGVTETPQVQTLHEWRPETPERSWHLGAVPIGRSGLGQVLVLDPRNGSPATPGVVGNLAIRSRVIAEPLGGTRVGSTVMTGDLGIAAPDGTIAYRGRADHQLSVGAELVDPIPVESALAAHPDVIDAAVLVDPQTGVLVALIATERAPEIPALRALVDKRLPASHVPARYLATQDLPRLANGKLNRAAVIEALASARPIVERYSPPRGETEATVARLVARVLGLARIGRHDRWSSNGADSLYLARIMGALGERFREHDGDLRYMTVRAHDSVADLAPLLVANEFQSASHGAPTRGIGEALSATAGGMHAAAVVEREHGMENFVSSALLLRGRGNDADMCAQALQELLGEARLDGVVIQEVNGVLRWGRSPAWRVVRLSRNPEPGWWQEAVVGVRRIPLGVDGAPLAVAAVIVGGNDLAVVIKVDHQVCDGESLALLLTRFVDRIAGRVADPLRPASDPPVKSHTQGTPWSWIDRDSPIAAALPSATRSASSLHRARRLRRQIPGDVVDKLRRHCQEAGVTEFVALLAISAHVVSRYIGEPASVALWVPVSNRGHDQADQVGMLTRLTPVIVPTDPLLSSDERLRRAEQALHRSLSERGTAAELAARLRQLGHDAIRPVQVLLAHQRAVTIPDDDIEVIEDDEQPRAIAPLCIRFSSGPDSILMEIDHLSATVDDWMATRIADHLLDAIEVFATSGDSGALPDADPIETARIISELDATARTDEGLDPTAGLLVTLREWPSRPAVAWDGGGLDYASFGRLVEAVASSLDERNIPVGAAVGVELPRGPLLVAAMFALLITGRVYLPIQPDLPAERRADMLQRGGAVLRLCQDAPSAPLDGAGPPTLNVAEIAPWRGDPTEVLAHRLEGAAGLSKDREAYRIFTSGSTGLPKCVSISVDNIRQHLRWMQDRYGLGPDDTVAFKTPIGFDPSVWELLWALGAGASLAVAREGGHVDAEYLLDFVARRRVTVMHVVPTLLATFLDHSSFARCRQLRLVISSGEALPSESVRRLAQQSPAQVVNLYGPTEATIDVSHFEPPAGHVGAMPIGRAVHGTALLVLDQDGRLLPAGVRGEIAIAGLQLAREYVGNPEETAKRFPSIVVAGRTIRVYKTGDLGVVDQAGLLYYSGRSDRQVKVGGVRIELGEVESVLERDERIAEARAVAVQLRDSTRLTAFVRPAAPGTALPIDQILTNARRFLPAAAIPRVLSIEAFPLLPNGKTDFTQLLNQAREGDSHAIRASSGDTASGNPRDLPQEEDVAVAQIARIWEDVLGVKIPHDANFFAVGGNSMDAIRVVAAMRGAGYQLDAADIMANPVLTDVAHAITRSPAIGAPRPPQKVGRGAFSLLSTDDLARLGQIGH